MMALFNTDEFMTQFEDFCMNYEEMMETLNRTIEEKNSLEKDRDFFDQQCAALKTENQILIETVKESKDKLSMICDLEDEIHILKSKKADIEKANEENQFLLDLEKKKLIKEHKTELEQVERTLMDERLKQVTALQNELDGSHRINCDLTAKLEEQELERKREMDKYDAKLREANKEHNSMRTEYHQLQRQMLNQDVMRKKMQHMESELRALQSQTAGGNKFVAQRNDTPRDRTKNNRWPFSRD